MAGNIPNPMGDNDRRGPETQRGSSVVDYVMPKVKHSREHRDQKYATRWKEYTRLWRGFYSEKDKNTDSERSRLIAPALQQAVEMTVAEMEEAVFNKPAWFDITDDIADENKEDAVMYRDQLLEDFEIDSVPSAITKAFLMGAIYGTGIVKINVERKPEKFIEDGEVVSRARKAVTAHCVRPDEFGIDPTALNIDEAEYCFTETLRPMFGIKEKQRAGKYNKGVIYPWQGVATDTDGTGTKASTESKDRGVLITEYYGKIPASMIGSDKKGLVEAIVTIANENILLKAIESPFLMQDRPIVAYQHDTVPGEFWGRGVCEKGYNPQKALDAELRARIDTLALITAPMMGADVSRLPRNPDMRVRPGKTIFTRGRPSEIYEPITFGNPAVLAHTFQHSGDLERMVQMGTGAMDSATPVGINSRNETASGMSQMQAGFIKRSKRTMQNMERQLLDAFVRKSLWRYMQFDPDRYPVDFKFAVNATMGIMAKEYENTQLTQMLGYVPPESPMHSILVQAIFDNSAAAHKKELKKAIESMNKEPTPEEQEQQKKMQELQLRAQTAQVEKEEALAAKEKALTQKAIADAKLSEEKARHERIEADLEDDQLEIQAANMSVAMRKTKATEDQNRIAAAKVGIEAKKASKEASSNGSNGSSGTS